jgi:hypothetical protein
VRAGGVFVRLLVGYEQEGRAGQKIEGLLGGWKPQRPPKLIEVIIAKLLNPLEPALVSVSTPAASTIYLRQRKPACLGAAGRHGVETEVRLAHL